MNQEPKKTNSKPVVTYILILFSAAFVLMAFSLVANQRSNDQTLDELRQSISSLEQGQTAHDTALSLQEKQVELEKGLLILEQQLEDAQAETQTWIDKSEQLQAQSDALTLLLHLEEYYRNDDADGCSQTIVYIRDTGADAVLYSMDDARYGNRYDELLDIITADWDEDWNNQP